MTKWTNTKRTEQDPDSTDRLLHLGQKKPGQGNLEHWRQGHGRDQSGYIILLDVIQECWNRWGRDQRRRSERGSPDGQPTTLKQSVLAGSKFGPLIL